MGLLLLRWLPAEQDQRAGHNGQDRHDQGEALKVQVEQRDQPGHDEPDAQQDHPQVVGQFETTHFQSSLFLLFKRFSDPGEAPKEVVHEESHGQARAAGEQYFNDHLFSLRYFL
jgi:hypothetical protein